MESTRDIQLYALTMRTNLSILRTNFAYIGTTTPNVQTYEVHCTFVHGFGLPTQKGVPWLAPRRNQLHAAALSGHDFDV